MGLSIVAGLIAVIGGAKPWAYRSVIGVMGFVVLDFTYETRSTRRPAGTSLVTATPQRWVLVLAAST